MKQINCAIVGYGNLGKAVEKQMKKRKDEFNLVVIFSRGQEKNTSLFEEIHKYKSKVDVVLFCGGSNTDAPQTVPYINSLGFSTVDCYDNHSQLKNQNYQNLIKSETDKSKTTAIIGAGWDPGYLSLLRILNKAIMPDGVHSTFYGGALGGLSMGHTNAIKQIPGVITACQLTVARQDSKEKALEGIKVAKEQLHKRVCYVVAESGREQYVEKQIREMEGYFKNQLVEVNFLTINEFKSNFKNKQNHAGELIGVNSNAQINLALKMDSNPQFTANAMLAFAIANYNMQKKGISGTYTIDEISPSLLLSDSARLCEI